MSRILLFIAFASIALQVSAQHQRRVLVEEYTQASCPPCATVNPPFNALLHDNDSMVCPIKYQVWWPGFDPMYLHNTTDVNTRVAYYDVTGAPDGYENGVNFYPGNYTGASIIAAYNNMTPVAISIAHTFNATYDTVFVTVSVTSDDSISGNLYLRTAVIEKKILFATAPGTNGEKEFEEVMKKMLPDAYGIATGNFSAGETKTYNFAWKMRNCYDMNQVAALAWLQDDDSKSVWQTERSDPYQTIPGGNFASVTIASSLANKLICTNTFTPVFTLKNLGANPLTAATINYTVSNGPVQEFLWSGSLNPGLGTSVSLPEVTLTSAGTNPIQIWIVNTDGGIQTNQVSSNGTIGLIAQFIAVSLPVTEGFENASFPPAGWGLKNAAAGGWEDANAGGYDQSSTSTRANFYSLAVGVNAELYLPKIDLVTATGNAWIVFDHAHTYYDATYKNDRLRIDVSTDCGTTWANLWDKMGDALATAPPQTTLFVPTADDWVTDSININSYKGGELLVRFRGTSGYGNVLYVDNINLVTTVSGTVQVLPLSLFTARPNPANDHTSINFNLDRADDIQLTLYNNLGIAVVQQQLGNLDAGAQTVYFETDQLPAGNYRVVLQGKNGLAQLPLAVVR